MSGVQPGLLERNHFLLRRLHSLSGVIPIGAFLINHLLANSLTPTPAKFNHEVEWIHSLPYLVFIEFGMIFLPLAFHAGYGVVIAMQAKHNVQAYGYADNVRFSLQRITGWIAAVFIVVHLLHFRFAGLVGGTSYPQVVHDGATPYAAAYQGFQSVLPLALWMIIYAIGIVASVYHFANGMCTFCITWGITVGNRSRKAVSIAMTGLALVLLFFGFRGLYGMSSNFEAQQPSTHELPADIADYTGEVGSDTRPGEQG